MSLPDYPPVVSKRLAIPPSRRDPRVLSELLHRLLNLLSEAARVSGLKRELGPEPFMGELPPSLPSGLRGATDHDLNHPAGAEEIALAAAKTRGESENGTALPVTRSARPQREDRTCLPC